MRISALVGSLLILLFLPLSLHAQEQSWIQVEAQPDLASAQARAAHYAALFDDVQGFVAGDWYAVALGPMDKAAAQERMLRLRSEGLIPQDSFLADGARYGAAFAVGTQAVPEPAAETATAPAAPSTAADAAPAETLAEAEAAEAALGPDGRKALQSALAWFGFYDGAIDGAFGRGTRAALAAWQEAQGLPATGVLLRAERAALLAAAEDERTRFGFEEVKEEAAGITAVLPLGLVAFQGYEPPFVQFAPRSPGGPRLMLISEPGEAASLAGLSEQLIAMTLAPGQTDPGTGLVLDEDSFTIDAAGGGVATRAWARLNRGKIKGFALIWTPEHAQELARMAEIIQGSFDAVGDKVLDPGLVPLDEAVRLGLVSGLTPRVPAFSRSGFYVSAGGAVLTLAQDLAGCASLSIDGGAEVRLRASDPVSGAALLQPAQPLAPDAVARLSGASPRPGTEVMLAGYSYGDRLPAPVLSYGVLEGAGDPAGQSGVLRLRLRALDGDRGGPVLNAAGEVIGMLGGANDSAGRALPEDLALSVDAATLAALMTAGGIAPPPPAAPGSETLGPEAQALAMTLRVDCWN